MATQVYSGRDYKIVNVNLTDAYQDIVLPIAVTSFAMQVRGGAKILWRKSATDTAEWTVKEEASASADALLWSQASSNLTIGQAKCSAAGATDVLEIWALFS